ncbi:hypothetical protein MPTK1_8g17090 [Marchantia polymorpha subsp. ruderalis]|uniref:Uncharacterized protein n=1 Tax=Marchantia polymorpha TaxID=3197 RepID=A0A2R6X861_MARPO|nr:hypothetical protein MARPO_0030s0042 [Marchantia polymorpha]BBN20180.1 hypothetical protein Mp_8g17090 [Marchantia polymorpha subsp. ruderalis]|eukprot:PTQ42296.1 hypothetical protein MARPO_0030s0042 [Marchantia polymorpha]
MAMPSYPSALAKFVGAIRWWSIDDECRPFDRRVLILQHSRASYVAALVVNCFIFSPRLDSGQVPRSSPSLCHLICRTLFKVKCLLDRGKGWSQLTEDSSLR